MVSSNHDDIIPKLRELMKRPEGTFQFNYSSKQLFDYKSGKGKLVEIIAGHIYFLLEREPDLILNFYHSSPGTGTRVSSIDLKKINAQEGIMIFLSWSPTELRLSVGGLDGISGLITGNGVKSPKQFRIDGTGAVVQIGDKGIEVMGLQVIQGGKTVLTSTAIQTWDETIKSIEFLLKGESTDGYLFESICTNLSIVILITGFESYCKRRFSELESEGINCNFDGLVKEFISNDQQENIKKLIEERAIGNKITPTHQMINQGNVNFQNYDNCKNAFRIGYGIKFAEDLGVNSDELKKLKEFINYRHRVIHVSPLTVFPKPDPSRGVGVKPPKNEYAHKGIENISKFVHGLHESSLKLRP